MKGWLIILAFTCSQAATSSAWPIAPDTPTDPAATCCCCAAGDCLCGCAPPTGQEPDPGQSQRSAYCSCDDQPIQLPESHRAAAERLSKLTVSAGSPDAHCVDLNHRTADEGPRAHGPPPNIALVKTFILLN